MEECITQPRQEMSSEIKIFFEVLKKSERMKNKIIYFTGGVVKSLYRDV